MNFETDEFGHVTVQCGWLRIENEMPDPEDNIVVKERGTEMLVICHHNGKKWIGSDEEVVDIEYWIRIPPLPPGDE